MEKLLNKNQKNMRFCPSGRVSTSSSKGEPADDSFPELDSSSDLYSHLNEWACSSPDTIQTNTERLLVVSLFLDILSPTSNKWKLRFYSFKLLSIGPMVAKSEW